MTKTTETNEDKKLEGTYLTAKIDHFNPAGEIEVRITDVYDSVVHRCKVAVVESLTGRDIFTVSAGSEGGYYPTSSKVVYAITLREITRRAADGTVLEVMGRPFSRAASLGADSPEVLGVGAQSC